ncbi:MAG TPA: hypothetical protein VER58_00645 [Thermoanaerobaculia bacterium]|nr:hypothetical protein [Thermoanaerobaculia bacterium]
MRRVLVAIAILALVQSVSAAVQYEFRQTTHSDLESMPSTDMTGRGVIDGDRSRVEFISGNGFAPGTYVISNNGSKTLQFVDPTKKTYVEVNAAGVATSIGAARITVSNKKVSMAQMDDHMMIAGLPTEHYRLTLDYDITLAFGNIPLTQTVHEVIDKWVTQAFGSVAETFLASGSIRTGNPDLDDLISTENTKIKGFALKQTMLVSTTTRRSEVPGSKLSDVFRPTRTQIRELTITSIEAKASVPADLFVVPATYHKPDPFRDDTQKAPLQILSFTPSNGR